ncbi:MAG: 3-oxoacyl-ACP synthase [Magnetococcales bacterium]|nr:3-oxoacyl-ACP synthase [Magnetococcales bacterium]|tara:strand:- start:7681 stop:8646 length:966 start_codon:yes stop_codon:yes gene_type:complete
MPIVITGTGSALPKKVVSNDDLAKFVETSDEWIQTRTGIQQRYFKTEGESTSTLAIEAANRAIESAGVSVDELDLVVVATATPDHSFPSVATQVQAAIGMQKGAAFDVAAACSGFIYALSVAENMIKSGSFSKALVIGAETLSNLITPEDRTTYVLFGDGAGAIVVENKTEEEAQGSGVIGTDLFSDGRFKNELYTDGGVSTTASAGHVVMNGREVFKHATRAMSGLVNDTLVKYNIEKEDIDWLVPHQANKRIIDATAKHLNLSADKVVLTVGEHANTSAASIPLAFDKAVRDGRIQKGQLIFFEAFGAGFTWASALVKF